MTTSVGAEFGDGLGGFLGGGRAELRHGRARLRLGEMQTVHFGGLLGDSVRLVGLGFVRCRGGDGASEREDDGVRGRRNARREFGERRRRVERFRLVHVLEPAHETLERRIGVSKVGRRHRPRSRGWVVRRVGVVLGGDDRVAVRRILNGREIVRAFEDVTQTL